jgi:hypothetical protein
VIALLSFAVFVTLWWGREELAEQIARLWRTYKRWTGYQPRRLNGPRIQSTVISAKEWEDVA